ncbi:MAG: hypothetical protein HYW97_02455 [Candidatus Wildermuthbacteria bacterium]|nr:hypothetical protein [Candidatus Wildermuthbacteria bacterium]
MEQHQRCPAVVIHCMDWRFRKHLNAFLDARFPAGYDLISLAGGIKSLHEDGISDTNVELKNLKLASSLHHPERIVLIQHEDCGAYGGSGQFANFEAEHRFQEEELRKAMLLLEEYFPQKITEAHFIRLSGEVIPLAQAPETQSVSPR